MPRSIVATHNRRHQHGFLVNVKFILGFAAGFVTNHMITILYKISSLPPSSSSPATLSALTSRLVESENSITDGSNANANCPATRGIYPLMRDFQCGHKNMETPRALRKSTGSGRGRRIVDVGLFDGGETLDAVEAGFVVFGFEMSRGSIPHIRSNAQKRGILDRLYFVDFVLDKGTGLPVPKDLPLPPKDGRGYAYIYNAGLSDQTGSLLGSQSHNAVASIGKVDPKWSPGSVPILRLDQSLPEWIGHIFFLKIDTQGFESKVLNGAEKYLRSNQIQYAQYEFSPKLMHASSSGDPMHLLKYMVSMGAICFDMMIDDEHHLITRPSVPLEHYFTSLVSGLNSTHRSAANNYTTDAIGPWDDILCWFPEATS